MKYDLTKPMKRGAKRVLNAFSLTLLHLLTKKKFEDININEICENAGYPRATFYNYFNNKQDLLYYFLNSFIKYTNKDISSIDELFLSTFHIFSVANNNIQRVLKFNDLNSEVCIMAKNIALTNVTKLIISFVNPIESLTKEDVATYYGTAFIIVLNSIIINQHGANLDETSALNTLHALIKEIN